MALLPQHTSPLEDVWVALDIECTGLSPDNDEVIEVGAVRFQGQRVLDTFQSLVNPYRRLSDFIKRYTGITQEEVDSAASFSAVAGRLAAFIGHAPVVGHNVGFDLGFLGKKGLRLANPRCDTWDMAFVLLPCQPDYSLARLALSQGIKHPRPHRALEDAQVTRELFLKLASMALELDTYTLAEMQRLAARSSWVLAYLLRGMDAPMRRPRPAPGHPPAEQEAASTSLATAKSANMGVASAPSGQAGPSDTMSITGLDISALGRRLHQWRPLRPNQQVRKLDTDLVVSLLRAGSPLATAMPGFEERPQQVEMALKVAEALNEGKRLIVEAGTGVGKSLAYLLPAALYALQNSKRVVISTNTINLQAQLLHKDMPVLVKALTGVKGLPVQDLRYTQLKGRANYLCLRRWSRLRASEALTEDEARLLAKTLVWLKTTTTGDRGELNLSGGDAAAPWDRVSAQGKLECLAAGGPCFVRAARERAAASHLVIVNHALLLSDVAAGGALLPEYDALIVDEAHHLEEEATRQLGFELGHTSFDEHIQALTGDHGLLQEAISAFRGSSASPGRRTAVEKAVADTMALLPRVRDRVTSLFATLATVVSASLDRGSEDSQDLRITQGTRSQPEWSQLEVTWENADLALSDLGKALAGLHSSLEGLEDAGLIEYESLLEDMAGAIQTNGELRQKLREFIPNPKPGMVYWVTRPGNTSYSVTLHAAPLDVAQYLDELLFSPKECVVLTSATLSTSGSFRHVCQRTGFSDAEELLLGSPFDYPRAALLCVPEDMPEPSSVAYQAAVQRAIVDAAVAAGGRTMALFTSYSALNATAQAIRSELQARGLSLLAQGADGTPQQLVRAFLENPRAVLLGTASFWEGVDLAGDCLQVLLVARLPFSVPTEPVFAARSELFEDPFNQYAVPQAVLRLRQGFGRLIRTRTDRGVAIILDRRITSRRYGRVFLDSLPPCTFKACNLRQLPQEIARWLKG